MGGRTLSGALGRLGAYSSSSTSTGASSLLEPELEPRPAANISRNDSGLGLYSTATLLGWAWGRWCIHLITLKYRPAALPAASTAVAM